MPRIAILRMILVWAASIGGRLSWGKAFMTRRAKHRREGSAVTCECLICCWAKIRTWRICAKAGRGLPLCERQTRKKQPVHMGVRAGGKVILRVEFFKSIPEAIPARTLDARENGSSVLANLVHSAGDDIHAQPTEHHPHPDEAVRTTGGRTPPM